MLAQIFCLSCGARFIVYYAMVLGRLSHVYGGVPEQSLHVFLTQMQIEQKKTRKGEVASVLE